MELSLNMGQPVSRSHTECSLQGTNNKIQNKGPTSLHTEPLLADLGALRGCKVWGPPLVGRGSLEGRGRQGRGATEGAEGGREGAATAPSPEGHRQLHLVRGGRWGGARPEQPRLGPPPTASTCREGAPRGPGEGFPSPAGLRAGAPGPCFP